MPLIAAYHRPTTVDDALSLLAGENRIVLAGGTVVNADRHASDLEVVDLQALGLSSITLDGDRLRLGAMATLADVSSAADVPDWLRPIARSEAPSTLRSLATVGGAVAIGGSESVICAALLTADAVVEFAGAEPAALDDVLTAGVSAGAIITAVTVSRQGTGAVAATGRTPADVPIVAAVARVVDGQATMALSGVAPRPVLVDPADPIAGLTPPDDFRGSREYRLELARTLAPRAEEMAR